jgi:hypothetical protein
MIAMRARCEEDFSDVAQLVRQLWATSVVASDMALRKQRFGFPPES